MKHRPALARVSSLALLVLAAWSPGGTGCARDPGESSEAGGANGGAGAAGATASTGGAGAPAGGATGGSSAGTGGAPPVAGTSGGGGTTAGAGGTASALPTSPKRFPFPQDHLLSGCAYPSARSSAAVRTVYDKWKAQLVTSNGAGGALRVQRPENASDTVSEGIGYGMLAAVYLDDMPTFDGLWRYAKAHFDGKGLMHWHIAAGGNVQEMGSATDADEDMAWALVMAARQFGSDAYLADGKTLIDNIWKWDIDHGRGEKVKAGDAWGPADETFPSYFAPAFYRMFAALTGEKGWLSVVDTSYELLAASGGAKGLSPETITFAGATKQANYKYNSCRIPWRIAMDQCLFGDARAKAVLDKLTAFFVGVGAANIVDGYDGNGNAISGNNKAMAFTGPAVVGAMGASAANAAFLDAGWSRLVQLSNDGAAFNYYQGSLGLLSLMMLSGNFSDFTQQ